MIITFDLSLSKIYKNALIFAIIGLWRNLMLIAIIGVFILAAVISVSYTHLPRRGAQVQSLIYVNIKRKKMQGWREIYGFFIAIQAVQR